MENELGGVAELIIEDDGHGMTFRWSKERNFARKVEAERFLAEQESRKARGVWLDPAHGPETLSSFWGRWLERALGAGRPSERTIASYREIWRIYLEPRLGAFQIASITRAVVQDLVPTWRSSAPGGRPTLSRSPSAPQQGRGRGHHRPESGRLLLTRLASSTGEATKPKVPPCRNPGGWWGVSPRC